MQSAFNYIYMESVIEYDLVNRYRGCLIGVACGDALGEQVEGKPRNNFIVPEVMKGGGFFSVPPGGWTDDTAMSLCLADSLITQNSFDLKHQIDTYLRWKNQGYLSCVKHPIGIGQSTWERLEEYEKTGLIVSQIQDPSRSAGNGSLMRLAPIPMAYRMSPLVQKRCSDSSTLTHNVIVCLDACRLYGVMIAAALRGENKIFILEKSHLEVLNLDEKIATIQSGSYAQKNRSEIKSTGYVVDTLEAALCAFYHSTSYRDGLLLAIGLGGDADTIGAVYGQLAGAFYGYSSIPDEWKNTIMMKKDIISYADKLLEISKTPFFSL